MSNRHPVHYEVVGKDEYQTHLKAVFPEDANGIYYTVDELKEKFNIKIGYSSSINFNDHTEDILVGNTILKCGKILRDAIDKLKDPKVKEVIFHVDAPGAFVYIQQELREAYGIWAKFKGTDTVAFSLRAPKDQSKVEPKILNQLKSNIASRCTSWIHTEYHFTNLQCGNTSHPTRMNNVVAMAKKLGLKQMPLFKDYSYATGVAVLVGMNLTEFMACRHPKVPAKTVKTYEKDLKAWWNSIKGPVKPE